MFGLIGKKLTGLIIGGLIFIIFTGIIIAAVLTFKPVHYVQDYNTDVAWLSKNLNGVEGGEYESCYECWNIFGTTQVSPGGDTNYHGYLRISSEEAEKLNNDYHWENDLNQLPDMGNIKLTSYNPNDWYVCEDFNKDMFYGMGMTDIRYNKNGTIIFSNEFN
jgi:hypothetical protein